MVCIVKSPVINGLQCKKSSSQWFAVQKVWLWMVWSVKSPVLNGLQCKSLVINGLHCKKSVYEWFAV